MTQVDQVTQSHDVDQTKNGAKVALVTGSGSGIGKAVANALLAAGYRVVLTGRKAEPLEAVAHAAAARGEQALAVPCDVGDPDAVDALFARIQSHWGRLDVLFNNAGVNVPGTPLEDLSIADWRRVIDTNLSGVFYCTRAAFRQMKAQSPRGGRIINNGSISAHAPRPGSVAYTATKHAITGLTKSTSLEGRDYDIACGQIDIGNAETDLASRMALGVRQANGTIATEPLMDVSNVATAVVYMASLSLDANVQFMTVMATKMPFVGRG